MQDQCSWEIDAQANKNIILKSHVGELLNISVKKLYLAFSKRYTLQTFEIYSKGFVNYALLVSLLYAKVG